MYTDGRINWKGYTFMVVVIGALVLLVLSSRNRVPVQDSLSTPSVVELSVPATDTSATEAEVEVEAVEIETTVETTQ